MSAPRIHGIFGWLEPKRPWALSVSGFDVGKIQLRLRQCHLEFDDLAVAEVVADPVDLPRRCRLFRFLCFQLINLSAGG